MQISSSMTSGALVSAQKSKRYEITKRIRVYHLSQPCVHKTCHHVHRTWTNWIDEIINYLEKENLTLFTSQKQQNLTQPGKIIVSLKTGFRPKTILYFNSYYLQFY